MTYRLGPAERKATSANTSTLVQAIARAGPASIGLMGGPSGPAVSGCPLATTTRDGDAMPRYRQKFVVTSPHVELEGNHGELSGLGLRRHNRSNGVYPPPVADAGAPGAAGLRRVSVSTRRLASLLGLGRRDPRRDRVVMDGGAGCVRGAAYPLGSHPVAHNSGGRC